MKNKEEKQNKKLNKKHRKEVKKTGNYIKARLPLKKALDDRKKRMNRKSKKGKK